MKFFKIIIFTLLPTFSFCERNIDSIMAKVHSMTINQLNELKSKLKLTNQFTNETKLIFETRIALLKGDETKYFEILVDLSNPKNRFSNEIKIYANLNLSRILVNNQLYEEALKKNKLSVYFSRKSKQNSKTEAILHERAGIYFMNKNFEEAYNYYLKGVDKFEVIEKSMNFNNLALCQIKLNDYTLALVLYNKGLQLVENKKDASRIEIYYLIKGNIGSLYLKINELKKAKQYLTEEYDYYCRTKNFNFDYISCLTDLIKIDVIEKKSFDKKWSDLIYCANKFRSNEIQIKVLNKIKEEIFSNLNQTQKKQLYQLGFKFQSSYIEKVVKNQKKITKLLYSRNLDALEKANALENQKINLLTKNNQYKTVILIIFSFLLLLFIYLYSKIKKQNKIQLKQNNLIQSQKTQISEGNQKLLELEISHQQEQLQSLSMNLKIKKETEERFLTKIKDLKKNKDLNPDNIINELQISVKNLIEVDKKLDISNKEYKHHNKLLFENLNILHPNLTNQEIEFCHYCIFGLSTKEISQITGKTVGSVRVYKNYIKNKLTLNKENDLLEYLNKLNTKNTI